MCAERETVAPRSRPDAARSSRVVLVEAAARLHFGLLAPCGHSPRQFGGVGAMVQQPAIRLCVRPAVPNAAPCSVCGPLAARAQQVLERVCAAGWPAGLPPAAVEIVDAPREHTGLGTGTQLALSIAAGWRTYAKLPELGPSELAKLTGRGQRSAIGVHGFFTGGLLVEGGQRDAISLAPLVARVALPDAWRFVLITPEDEQGLWGEKERAAFRELARVPEGAVDRLCRVVLLGILPAAAEGEFAAFSEALYEFGREAGQMFACVQGGVFTTPSAAARVAHLRALGVRGVGQSSWGPTVFALVESEDRAAWLAGRLSADGVAAGCRVVVAPPANSGATIRILEGEA
ncbi:MAG: hypothetical protein K6T86_18185 [Pirellulales bacterium]|nr:hypothetical protein [Pirellulales bacterium]